MKKIYLLFVLSVLCMSCSDDFISKNPPSDLNSEGFYKTETDMNQAVLSAYANLRSLYNQTYVRLGEIRSDNTTYSWLSEIRQMKKELMNFHLLYCQKIISWPAVGMIVIKRFCAAIS